MEEGERGKDEGELEEGGGGDVRRGAREREGWRWVGGRKEWRRERKGRMKVGWRKGREWM